MAEAVTWITVRTVTCCVEMVKVAVVAPAATVTVAGTDAADPPIVTERFTTYPPAGAGALRVTVPVAG